MQKQNITRFHNLLLKIQYFKYLLIKRNGWSKKYETKTTKGQPKHTYAILLIEAEPSIER